ncbi:MAG: hypothetical protein KIT20_13910 [Alphaproteobacteria bacterium]|nr:hypothetical protein [Alphaproteobacteria bacterium]
MKFVAIGLGALLLQQVSAIPKSQELEVEPPVDVRKAFSGNTISATIYRSHAEPLRKSGQKGADTLSRLILHAYLAEDGRASVRVWDEPSGQWKQPVGERWSVEGETFCLSAERLSVGLRRFCMETIVWHGVFSGTSVPGGGDFMVKGNLMQGNPQKL